MVLVSIYCFSDGFAVFAHDGTKDGSEAFLLSDWVSRVVCDFELYWPRD